MKLFYIPGFYFTGHDLQPPRSRIDTILSSNRYVPDAEDADSPELTAKERAVFNITIAFGAICHFSTFHYTFEFWSRLAKLLDFHVDARGHELRMLAEIYCEGWETWVNSRPVTKSPYPDNVHELLVAVEAVNRHLRQEIPPDVPPFSSWAFVTTKWESRLQSVVPSALALARCALKRVEAPTRGQMNSNGKRPLPITPEDGSRESTSSISPETVPKRPALEKDVLGTDATQLTERVQKLDDIRRIEKRRIDKLESRLHVVEKTADRSLEAVRQHASRINDIAEQSQETRHNFDEFAQEQEDENEALKQDIEDLGLKLEDQIEDTTTQMQSMQAQIKAMQDQIKQLQDTIKKKR